MDDKGSLLDSSYEMSEPNETQRGSLGPEEQQQEKPIYGNTSLRYVIPTRKLLLQNKQRLTAAIQTSIG